jgi:hypothetical protein
VGGGDGANDGQTEAVAAVAAGRPGTEPLEGLEQPVDIGGRDDLPGAGHRQDTVVLSGVTITGYQAGPGWDPVTGWGTPDAQVLIPLLAR